MGAAIAAIIGAIAGLVALKSGGVFIGLAVFFAIFLLLSGGGLTFLAGVSPTAIIALIVIIILFKIINKK